MIAITIIGEDLEQDIRPLLKAFYPDAVFQVTKKKWDDEAADVKQSDGRVDFGREKDCCERKDPDREEGSPWKKDAGPSYEYAFYLKETEGFFVVAAPDRRYRDSFSGVSIVENRRAYKNCLFRRLYRILAEMTKKEMPWGILTGVRPTKQILEKLEAGESAEQITDYLREEYYCSEEKIETGLAVAEREKKLLESMDYRNGYSLYIGIPFCPSTCYYCSFPSFPLSIYGNLVEDYFIALQKEIRYAGKEAAAKMPKKKLQAIYIGGGTPTTFSKEQLDRLFFCIEESFDLSGLVEMTVEAGRPDSITREKLQAIRAHRAGRISINPQTMKQETLDLIGRKHTVEQIEESFFLARSLGFQTINMDIILGLAKETPADVEHTLEKIGQLAPENLTVHTLAIKRAARLNTKKEEYAGLEAENVREMLAISRDFAKRNHYHPYYLYRQKNMTENLENIGYSKDGKEGLYNVLIMEERQTILALGAGATSKFVFRQPDRMERVENVKNLKDYIGRIDEMIDRKRIFLEQHGDEL